MKQILWVISDQMGCGSYRAYVPALTLKERGVADSSFVLHHACETDPHGALDGMDVVVFQRAVAPAFVEWIKVAKRRGLRTVFEMDDDLFKVAKHNPAGAHWGQKSIQRLLRTTLDAVDHVICSTRPLLENVQQEMGWRTTDKFSLCHNHLHPAVWGPEILGGVMPYPNQTTVIGWQGSITHEVDFKEAVPALARILREYPHVSLRLFGSTPLAIKDQIPEHRFQWVKGVEFHRYPTMLRFVNFDIGIAPIVPSRFNRGKSNIKWLEYAACGVPCVASEVYPYARSITPGVTGYLAKTTEDWYGALKALVESPEHRWQMGQQARAHVWQTWSADQRASAWEPALGLPVMEAVWPTVSV